MLGPARAQIEHAELDLASSREQSGSQAQITAEALEHAASLFESLPCSTFVESAHEAFALLRRDGEDVVEMAEGGKHAQRPREGIEQEVSEAGQAALRLPVEAPQRHAHLLPRRILVNRAYPPHEAARCLLI